MRTIDPTMPIILNSGFTRDLAVKDLRNQGFFAFLAKPFQRNELARVIAEAIETRRQITMTAPPTPKTSSES